jgi:hypothetical protein
MSFFNNNLFILFILFIFISVSIICVICNNNNNKDIYGKGEISSIFANNFKYWTSSEEDYNEHTKTVLHRAITEIYKNKDKDNNNSLYKNLFSDKDSYFNQFKNLLQQEEHIKNITYNDPSDNGNTPLHLAVNYNLLSIIELIINKNTQPVNLQGSNWHEIEALENNTVFVNVFGEGTY